MAIEKRTLEIAGYTYEVTQLEAQTGRKVFVRLANTLGTAFATATSTKAVLGNLLMKLREEDLIYFCDMFGGQTTVTGNEFEDKSPYLKGLTFGQHFAGQYGRMFEWLTFSVLANFQSFFDDLPMLLEKYGPKDSGPKVQEMELPEG